MFFKATLDRTARLITGFVILIFILNSVLIITASNGSHVSLVFVVLLLGLAVGMYLYSVKGYSVDSDALNIVRPIGNKTYFYSDIRSARRVDREETKGMIRTLGNGGMWGYTGKFYNKTLGSLTLYATRRYPAVLVTLQKGTKLLLTPDDAEGMTEAMQERLAPFAEDS